MLPMEFAWKYDLPSLYLKRRRRRPPVANTGMRLTKSSAVSKKAYLSPSRLNRCSVHVYVGHRGRRACLRATWWWARAATDYAMWHRISSGLFCLDLTCVRARALYVRFRETD
ncbi:hypothetical protein J6590_037820 [Homalodisca vitripennis]|nr:hypothetical protein J6590_037820 [Homalodisca vitripennis]